MYLFYVLGAIDMPVPSQDNEWSCVYVLGVIDMPVPSQDSEWSCIYVLLVSVLPLSTIFVIVFWDCFNIVVFFHSSFL